MKPLTVKASRNSLIGQVISFIFFLQLIALISCSKNQDNLAPVDPPRDTTVHVTGISIDPPEFILVPTLTWQLTAGIAPANAGNKNATWSSSDNTVATVDNSGTVTALKEGTANIMATSIDNSLIKASAKLTVLKNYNVYAVGKGSTSGWYNQAVYWQNGAKSGLTGSTSVGAEAYAILLSGADVYIAGNTLNQGNWNIPTYWKNGEPHIIGDFSSQQNSYTKGITVDGNKVYLVNYRFNNTECSTGYCYGRSRASYFVDDGGIVTEVPLYDDISSTMAHGILLNGTEVIVAGSQANDNFFQWSISWKNTVTTTQVLSPTDGFYESMAVARLGTDLYYTGYGGCPYSNCKTTAFVWKNNRSSTIPLTDGNRDAIAYCMAFSSDTLYVGGYEKNAAGKYVAKYWKIIGDKVISRTLSDGTNHTLVNGIAVSGNDIFLIGNEFNDGDERKAKCWRAWEGGSTPAYLDLSEYYVPGGNQGFGIAIK